MKTLKTINEEFDKMNSSVKDRERVEVNKSFITSQIKELLEELVPEKSNDYEETGRNVSDLIYKDMGYNKLRSELQEKIKKIIN